MLTDDRGRFLSQRTHPLLAQIQAHVTAQGLKLSCPDSPPIYVQAFDGGAKCQVRVWDDHLSAWDAGEEVAVWLRQALGVSARLVRVSSGSERFADRMYVGEASVPVAFSDGYPILVCSVSSLAELNRRLPEPVPMDRFRPNVVVDGLEAFAEDHIEILTIGKTHLRLVKPCTRCQVPSIDQCTGLPSTDPMPALKTFRFDRALRGVTFGVNAIVMGSIEESLLLGQPLTIQGRRP